MRTATEWLKEPENRQLVQAALRRNEIEGDGGTHVVCDFDDRAMAIALTSCATYMVSSFRPADATTAYELESSNVGGRQCR